MSQFKNDRFIKALLREPVDRTPVWLMRQAGRYLPEYRELRSQKPSFVEFCKSPELACEATLQPLRRYDLDAAIVFSDILVIPEAMGMHLEFVNNEGPVFRDPIRSATDLSRLKDITPEVDLDYVLETITKVTHELNNDLPLIGFAGSPWTVATYMVEGGGSKMLRMIRSMLYREPEILEQLLEKITTATIAYLSAQVKAGARALMVFDTWGGVLSTEAYQQFSLRYMQRIAEQVTRTIDGHKIPLIFFTKNGGQWLELIADSGCDGVGLDWTMNIADARARVGDKVALQGNLDPYLLFASPDRIKQEVRQIIESYGKGSGHVFNLGHGVDKDTPPEHVAALVEAVKDYGTISA